MTASMSARVTTWHPGVVLSAVDLSPEMIAAIKAALSPAQRVALTAWAEARSRFEAGQWLKNPVEAMAHIVNVIDNRARDPRWRAIGHAGVPFVRWAFSCWEPTGGPDQNHDPRHLADNFEALLQRAQRVLAGEMSETLRDCLALAEGAVAGALVDALSGATHYYADWMSAPPAWSFEDPQTRQRPRPPTLVAYGHRFYNRIA